MIAANTTQYRTEYSPKLSLRFDPEYRFILLASHIRPTERRDAALRHALNASLDWDKVASRARLQKLDGLVFHQMHRSGFSNDIPGAPWTLLHGWNRHNNARWMLIRAELRRILKALTKQGIPTVLLKGAALALTVYDDGGMRRMADIDLLVPDHQAEQAQAAIEALGYEPGAADERESEQILAHHRHLPALVGTRRRVIVEVHRHIVRRDNPRYFEIEPFWERALPIVVDGLETAVFSPEDQIIHLCVNFILDRRYRTDGAVSQLADIAAVIENSDPAIDWEGLERRAEATGTGRLIGFVLTLVKGLLDVETPVQLSRDPWLLDMSPLEIELFIKGRVLNDEPFHVHGIVGLENRYGMLSVLSSTVRRIIPTGDYMRYLYGAKFDGFLGKRFYFTRLGQAARIMGSSILRPTRLRDDIQIDRMIHSLFEG